MKTLFPTIWYCGHEAAFYVGEHLVRVPINLERKILVPSSSLVSVSNAEHVIPWLISYWPFHVEVGGSTIRKGSKIRRKPQPMVVKKKHGEKILLHKVYARLLGHNGVVEAADDDLLHWTVENIGPRRKPEKIVPQGSQDSEVNQQMQERAREGSIKFYLREHARLLGKLDGVLTAEELTAAKTESVQKAERWEGELAARRTRADADAARQQRNEYQAYPDYENLTPEPGTKLIAKRTVTSSSWDESNDEADNLEAMVPDAIIQDTSLEDFRASLNPVRHASGTEAVLNRHGWKTPGNNHHPEYLGSKKGKRVQ